MQKRKFSFTSDFIKNLFELSEGYIPSDKLEKVIRALETEAEKYYFNSISESNLLRILNAVYDKKMFISDLELFPHHIEIIISIAASSNYLTDIVVRNPEYLYQVFDQNYLQQKMDFNDLLKEIKNGLEKYNSLNSKLNFLRQYKKRYTLKVGLTDILGLSDLRLITLHLSHLAKAINAALFETCYYEIIRKYQLIINNEKYTLCSLGKLGGSELNYSSDVDLILFYNRNEQYISVKKFYSEILSEAALLFIQSSTDVTNKGYIYRVDFRLRPDGKYSPLCMALTDYTKYYETRGEDWERQMLIKLDYICGDINLYKEFYNFLQPYIFPSSFSSSLKEQIKKMKNNIERMNKEKENVKLFKGGIRDIEFSVQALQLLNGGKYKELRTGNTLEAISLLYEKKLLKKKEKELFTDAYTFYRRTEHFLQLMNDTQTHLIPEEGEILYKLSNYLGFKNPQQFKAKVKTYRDNVRKIYNNILQTETGTSVKIFDSIKFKDNNRAQKNIQYLRTGSGYFEQKEFDSRTIKLFEQIEPELVRYLLKSLNPDRTLENFVKIIRSVKFTSMWYSELTNKKILKDLLFICEFSDKAVNLFATDKTLEEIYLSKEPFIKDINDYLPKYSPNQIIFILSIQLTLGLISPARASKLIADYIDITIKILLKPLSDKYKYFVGGMGSLGTSSMNFASDIDLIIVTDIIEDNPSIQNDFQNFSSTIINKLKPFEVDFRLRPEGKKSPLVWGIKHYKTYMESRARMWEFQALSKLRFISGDIKIYNELTNSIYEGFGTLNYDIRKEIKQMYLNIQKSLIVISEHSFNIKKQKGGLLTIDFIIQTFVLTNKTLLKKCIGKETSDIFSYVKKYIEPTDYILLKENYNYLRRLEFSIQTVLDSNNTIVPSDEKKRLLIAQFLKLNIVDFNKRLNDIIKSNNILFDKYVG